MREIALTYPFSKFYNDATPINIPIIKIIYSIFSISRITKFLSSKAMEKRTKRRSYLQNMYNIAQT